LQVSFESHPVYDRTQGIFPAFADNLNTCKTFIEKMAGNHVNKQTMKKVMAFEKAGIRM
jgi:hypothetical protein